MELRRQPYAFKTELDPTEPQKAALKAHADASRFAYNWGLQRKIEVMNLNKLPLEHINIPTAMDLHKELVRLKHTQYRWLEEVSKCAPQEALRDLDAAFKNFYRNHRGFPRFKSKKWTKKSFTITGDKITVADNCVRLPILGWVKLKEDGYLLPEGAVHIKAATVSERAGRWFVSLNVEEDVEPVVNHGPVVGIDLGINHLIAVSDGTFIENPKALSHGERRLKHIQRSVSRKKAGSHNRAKAVQRLARAHLKIANIRKDAINKATTRLARSKSVIVIEALNVAGMMKNHHLAKSVADAAFGEIRRQLERKTVWYGSRLVKVDRFFPSTKQCSQCGFVKTSMPLSERTFRCPSCGFEADRDSNASKTLEEQWPSVRWTLETPVEEGVQLDFFSVQPSREAGNATLAGQQPVHVCLRC